MTEEDECSCASCSQLKIPKQSASLHDQIYQVTPSVDSLQAGLTHVLINTSPAEWKDFVQNYFKEEKAHVAEMRERQLRHEKKMGEIIRSMKIARKIQSALDMIVILFLIWIAIKTFFGWWK